MNNNTTNNNNTSNNNPNTNQDKGTKLALKKDINTSALKDVFLKNTSTAFDVKHNKIAAVGSDSALADNGLTTKEIQQRLDIIKNFKRPPANQTISSPNTTENTEAKLDQIVQKENPILNSEDHKKIVENTPDIAIKVVEKQASKLDQEAINPQLTAKTDNNLANEKNFSSYSNNKQPTFSSHNTTPRHGYITPSNNQGDKSKRFNSTNPSNKDSSKFVKNSNRTNPIRTNSVNNTKFTGFFAGYSAQRELSHNRNLNQDPPKTKLSSDQTEPVTNSFSHKKETFDPKPHIKTVDKRTDFRGKNSLTLEQQNKKQDYIDHNRRSTSEHIVYDARADITKKEEAKAPIKKDELVNNQYTSYKPKKTVAEDLEDQNNKKKFVKNTEPRNQVNPAKRKLVKRVLNNTDLGELLADEYDDNESFEQLNFRRNNKNNRKAPKAKKAKILRNIKISGPIIVSELAAALAEKASNLVKELDKLGVKDLTSNSTIDPGIAELVASVLGHKTEHIKEKTLTSVIHELNFDANVKTRPPVVTIMGHVDHGKTSLLDALRHMDINLKNKNEITAGEAGGITQHIGAYNITLEGGQRITFIDTPGHEAFNAMRSRGARTTDVVILVVAGDDGIRPQTIESIKHIKEAKVPVVVAVNKMDKPGADINKVKHELLKYELISEDLGGDIMLIGVSALKKTGLQELLEATLLVAEMMDLRARYEGSASGTVIETKHNKNVGVLITLLVQDGLLRVGDILVVGASFGKIKKMRDDKGIEVKEAVPGMPIEVMGLSVFGCPGDRFAVVKNEKIAQDLADKALQEQRSSKDLLVPNKSQDIFKLLSESNSNKSKIKYIIRTDTQGSLEAIIYSLQNIKSEEVEIQILQSSIGEVNNSDLLLAKDSAALILAFNIKVPSSLIALAEREKVTIKQYSIIYNLLEDTEAHIKQLIKPVYYIKTLGTAEIRKIFNITKVGKIAGSYVKYGLIKRGMQFNLRRPANTSVSNLEEMEIIYSGKIKTLKRNQEDATEVKEGFECGIGVDFNEIKDGDIIETFETLEKK